MKKKLLSLFLALTLCVGLSIPALADTYITYPHLEIGENGLYSLEPEDNPKLDYDTSGKGWSWNASTYTLTLDNVSQPELSLAVCYANKPVTIVVKGTNTMSDLSVAGLQNSTLTGSGTLNLSGSCRVSVVDGPTVNCSESAFFDILKQGVVTTKRPVCDPFDIQGGCFIIDIREYMKLYDWVKGSAIEVSSQRLPEAFLQGCTLKDENGAAVTLELQGDEIYSYIAATKADGSPASYVKITAPGYTPFADVKASDYFAAPVGWAVDRGITDGTSATTFSPAQTCTRAQIITFLWRAAGSPEPQNISAFSDVKTDTYYSKAVAWAKENGMVSGDTFSPEAPCTRLMAVEFMWKHAGSPNAAAASFSDVSSPAVDWAVEQGVTDGTSDTTFSPDNTCTRGQIVTFLYRGFAK